MVPPLGATASCTWVKHEVNRGRIWPSRTFEIFSRDHAVLRKIAFAYVDINNVPKAVRFLKAVFEADNTDWHVADVLTKLHVDTDLSAAEQWAYAAFKAGSPNALFNLGRVQQLMYERQQSGDVREGERRISPSDVELWYRRSLEQSKMLFSYGRHFRQHLI